MLKKNSSILNFIFSLFIYIVKIFFLLFPAYLCHFFTFNYMWGSFNSFITAFQGILPILSTNTLFGTVYAFSYIGAGTLLFKLPSIVNIVVFHLLKKYPYILTKLFIAFSFFVSSYYFIYVYKHTPIYTLFWLFTGSFILFSLHKKYHLFEIAWIASWAAHGTGTMVNGIATGFLSDTLYKGLTLITLLERILLIFSLMIYSRCTDKINFYFQKIQSILLKKINS